MECPECEKAMQYKRSYKGFECGHCGAIVSKEDLEEMSGDPTLDLYPNEDDREQRYENFAKDVEKAINRYS